MHKTDQHTIDFQQFRALAESSLPDSNAANSVAAERTQASQANQFLVSIYAPMQMAGREVKQNVIRWKNLLKEARQKLDEQGLNDEAIDERLQSAEELLGDDQFWQHQSRGLAVFVSGDETKVFRLPQKFDQTVVVGSQFYLRPLLHAVQAQNSCYVLAASANRVRLFRTDGRQEIEELDQEALPANLVEALNIDEYVSALQLHTSSHNQATQGRQPAIHHGHGGSGQEVRKKDELVQFFQCLSRALDNYFEDDMTPLVFAGVDYLFPIFRSTFKRPHLCDTAISGNPDDWSADTLKEKAWLVFEEIQEDKCRDQVKGYEEKASTDWVSAVPQEIASAARLGQVELLLLARPAGENGSGYNADAPDADSVANRAIIETLRNGGTPVSIPAELMPAKTTIAAVFRSPASRFVDAVKAD